MSEAKGRTITKWTRLCFPPLSAKISPKICHPNTKLGAEGYPEAEEAGHGVGTREVVTFAAKHDAELLYHVGGGVFSVRLLL